MSNTITTSTPSSGTAASQSAAPASQVEKRTNNSVNDTPTVSASASTSSAGRPMLSPPTLSASAMMLALMSLQTQATNESVKGGLESCSKDQVDVAAENKARAEDMYGYYETMRASEDVNGAMSVVNILLALIFLIVALASVIATGGASAPILAAGVMGAIAAASSLCGSVFSLPAVQESIGENASKIANIVCSALALLAGIASMGAGIGGLKAAGKSAGKVATDLAQDMVKAPGKQQISAKKMVQIANIAASAIGGTLSSSLTIASASFAFEAAEGQSKADEHSANLEEIQNRLDKNMNSVQTLMDSFASMIDSTANMLTEAAEGQRAAASV